MDEQTALDGLEPPGLQPVPVARVIVDVDFAHLDRPLDYLIPESLVERALVGVIVRVPLAGKIHNGWIESVSQMVPEHRLQPIASVVSRVPVTTPMLLTIARSIADRHVATLPQTLSLAIPARHAGAEKEYLAQAPATPHPPAPPEGTAWADHRNGALLLSHLAHGDGPRSVWSALGPTRDARLMELVLATRASGRSVIVVVPTSHHAQLMHSLIEKTMSEPVGLSSSDTPASERYRLHLDALAGSVRIIVGTRSAVWTPAKDLGLIIVWDDGDDHLHELRAPRCDALDVAVTRAHLEGCGLVAAGYSRSVKAQSLVATGWAVSLTDDHPIRRSLTPSIRVLDESDAEAAGPSGRMRIPPQVVEFARGSMADGPVLIQVASAGYIPVISCDRCHSIARCSTCSGTLSVGPDSVVSCEWCGREVSQWRCRTCSATRIHRTRIGSDRTGEEIARTLKSNSILVSSSTHRITRFIDARPQIVVSTAGAEPIATGGYVAAIILDTRAIGGRPELWAPEEAMRRWFNALALVRPEGRALFAGGVEAVMAQCLIRWDPADMAQRLYDERAALGFFPAAMIIALDGCREDVRAVAEAAKAEEIGTVEREAAEGELGVRTLIRAPREQSGDVLKNLARAQAIRSSRKMRPVKITVNPPELF